MGNDDDFGETRPAGPDRRDNVASAGLDPDTWDELEEYRTDHRMSRSETTRQLIRDGLDGPDRTTAAGISVALGIAYAAGVTIGSYQFGAIIGGVHIVAILGWSLYGELR